MSLKCNPRVSLLAYDCANDAFGDGYGLDMI